MTLLGRGLTVHQAMNHPALMVEAMDDPIEEARVAVFIASPDRPRQEIRDLNQT